MNLPNTDPCLEQAAVSDENLLSIYEKILTEKPDTKGGYSVLPLALLFFFSALIFFSSTYLNKFSGGFDAMVYNETQKPSKTIIVPVKLDPVAVGKKLFNSGGACVTCHQPNGQGVPGAFPPLVQSEWVQGTPDRVIRIVLFGLQGPVKVRGGEFGAAAMPAFGPIGTYNWSDDKIAAVLTYVRQEWGNKASPITPQQVTAIRTAEASRNKAWTQDELLKIK
ncbi:MAG: cytochrome c [Verrucomicrobiota bacterium]|nr:cytochrome c [Verrucomicrobiota bacterium]